MKNEKPLFKIKNFSLIFPFYFLILKLFFSRERRYLKKIFSNNLNFNITRDYPLLHFKRRRLTD